MTDEQRDEDTVDPDHEQPSPADEAKENEKAMEESGDELPG